MSKVIDATVEELVKPFQKLGVSEAEYALLHVVCLCSPVPRMSKEGADIIREAREKYMSVLSQLMRHTLGPEAFDATVHRISNLLLALPAAERVAQLDDAALTLMSMFNYAGFQGTLTWELHVKRSVN
ncbi:Protein NHR-34 a [Aphelenchoides avenae]|nr:Protein NHR-34 a [Aphelenchus avenae]